MSKKIKDLFSENWTLKKETEEDTNKWKAIPCSWTGRTNTVKMTMIPKTIYRVNATPIKILMVFLTGLEQIILRFVWEHKDLE